MLDDRGVIAVMATAFIGWSVWLTRKAFGAMSRKEHETVCDKKTETICKMIADQNAKMDRVVERIFEKLEAERRVASEKREDLHEKVNETNMQVAALRAIVERRLK